MKLRDYQERLINGLSSKLSTLRKIVGQLATGGGKTVVFCGISHRYITKSKKRVLILVDRKELLKQTRKTAYNAFGLECHPVVAGNKYIPDADIYVGMVETVFRRIDKFKEKNIGLVIIDEAHKGAFNKLHEHFQEQLIIGFTATPLATSKKKPMKMFYEDIVCGVDIPELIADGHLCQNITWAPKETVDRLTLEMNSRGDFDDTIMGNAFSKPKYITNTVNAYEKWGKDTKTIIFNVNIFHSKEVTNEFVSRGYNCKHLDGEMGKEEREEILLWFANTPDAILCNVGIATTGFDEPTIETVMVNKATMSMPLWLQMCGRGSRPTEQKSMFTIVDMGGNAVYHGDWNQSRNWEDIFHNPPKPGKATAAPVKSCPMCDAIVPASTRKCAHCGYTWESKDIPVEAELHEFIVVTKGIDVQKIMDDNLHRKEYYAFHEIGRRLADDAKKTIPQMTDEIAQYILGKYFDLGREWCHKHHKKLNQWHKARAQEVLYEHLERRFKDWQKPGDTKVLIDHMKIANLEPIKKLA